MRLNAKVARELRAAAQYRQQTATPSKPTFPGVARFYTMPVYARRSTLKSSYERKNGEMVRVFTKVSSLVVVGRKGREPIPVIVMGEHAHPATFTDKKGVERPHPKAGQKYMGPKLEMVPATKPISATGEKKVYRQLKRLHAQGLLKPGRIDLARLGDLEAIARSGALPVQEAA